jgi:hypothetical protein
MRGSIRWEEEEEEEGSRRISAWKSVYLGIRGRSISMR